MSDTSVMIEDRKTQSLRQCISAPRSSKQEEGAINKFREKLADGLSSIVSAVQQERGKELKIRYWCEDETRLGLQTINGLNPRHELSLKEKNSGNLTTSECSRPAACCLAKAATHRLLSLWFRGFSSNDTKTYALGHNIYRASILAISSRVLLISKSTLFETSRYHVSFYASKANSLFTLRNYETFKAKSKL